MGVPLVDLKAQYATIRDEIRVAIDRVLESQEFILGVEVAALEMEVAEYSQCTHAVGVSSGSDALLAALMAIGIQPGDEVITSPYTFYSTVSSIVRLGAKPVFVDIDPETYNLDPRHVEAKISARTRALVPVHLFGQAADIDLLLDLASTHDLMVIEDAAQAIGAEYKGRRVGSLGHMGCFSFFPSKNLGGYGDGGMLTTNDAGLAERLQQLRNHGAQTKYIHTRLGGNFRLDALQAAVLRIKLKRLDAWTEARRRCAETYRELFAPYSSRQDGCPISLPVEAPTRRHTYHQFIIQSPRRDRLLEALRGQNIGADIYYHTPLHLQPCFAALGYRPGDFPYCESAAVRCLALPIYPELTRAMQEEVVRAVVAFHTS